MAIVISDPVVTTNMNQVAERDAARVLALQHLRAINPEADHVLQELVDDVRAIYGTELCMVNLMLADAQYFRIWSGDLPPEVAQARQIPMALSMCRHVVCSEKPLVIHDLDSEARFRSEFVCVNYGIRFYAGTPLVTSDGVVVGSLCLLDSQPRTFDETEQTVLAGFAKAVMGRLEALGALEREREASRAREVLYATLQATTMEEAERAATELQRTLDISLDIIARIALDETILTINPACYRILGYEPEELLGQPYTTLIHPEDRERTRMLPLHREGEQVSGFQTRCISKDGAPVWMEWNATPMPGEGVWYCVARDITGRKALEDQLQHQAFYDPLTGLANRALLLDRLEHALARSERSRGKCAVLLLDLDRFKVVNDSLGHQLGDQLLAAAGRRLQGCARPQDTVARLGGDEFAILLENVMHVSDAVRVAERVHSALGAPYNIADRLLTVAASIGIAVGATARETPVDLLRDADVAMYRAKVRDGCEVFDVSMKATAMERLNLEADLRCAVERGQLRLHYQPIFGLIDHDALACRLAGTEALLRWQHPERGLVSPLDFIPLAEETGLILPIGQWVLREACRQTKLWQDKYPSESPLTISVNLSARQFQHPEIVDDIAQVLSETQLDASSLQLELTESILMEDSATSMATLGRLKALGVRLAIDDFGTGYSSLSYLKRFPVDTLKVDRSFVDGLGSDHDDTAIVRAIMSLALALRLEVIGEGVETPDQADQLRALGCHFGQGHYFARPLPPEAAGLLIAGSSHRRDAEDTEGAQRPIKLSFRTQ